MSRITSTAGITQGLNAPGVAAVQPTLDPDLQLAEQALNALGGSFSVLADQARRKRAEEERSLAKHEVVVRGEHALQSGVDLQGFDSAINDGSIAVPSSHDEVLTLAESLVADKIKESPDAGADEYRKRTLVPLINLLNRKREAQAAAARDDLSIKIEAGLTGVDDPMAWTQAMTYATDTLKMTPAEALSLVVRAMNANAALGHADAVTTARGVLGDREGAAQAAADATLQRITARQRSEEDGARADATQADLERFRRGQITESELTERTTKRYADEADMGQAAIEGVKDQVREWRDEQRIDDDRSRKLAADNSIQHAYRHINEGQPEQAIAFANRERKNGNLSQTQASTIIDAAKTDIRQRESESVRRAVIAAKERFNQESINEAAEMVTLGQLPLIDKKETTLPDGDTASMSKEERREAGIEIAMARINAANADDPQAMLSEQVLTLARNGATYSRYADVMQAGARAALIDLTGQGEEVKINQNTIAGFELYRNMLAISAATADDHLDDISKPFYRFALGAFEFGPDRGNAERALAEASKIMSNREAAEFRAGQVDRNQILKDINSRNFQWGFDDLKNREDLAHIVYKRAETMALINMGSEAATKAAVDTLKSDLVIINGYGVFKKRTNLPQQYIEVAGDKAIELYWSQHGAAMQEQGIERDDLTMAPIDQNSWMIVRGATGEPVSNWSEGGFFTNSGKNGLIELVDGDPAAKAVVDGIIANTAAREAAIRQRRGKPSHIGQGETSPMTPLDQIRNLP